MSQYILTGMYWNGSAELPQDRKLAIDWMRRSAESGYWGAYAWFAELNSGGVAGFAKKAAEAEIWYRQGIEKVRDEMGKSLLRDRLSEFQQRELQARWAERAEKARLERQTGNLPPEASDIQPLLLAAWAKHLNKGDLQADGTFSKTDPLLGVEWARNEMSVEDVSCVKDLENDKCGGYKCDFAARVRAVGGLAGIFGELSDGRITRYRLHFHWTRNGLEAPNLDKVMEQQAEVERAR